MKNNKENLRYYLGFSEFPGIGPVRLNALIQYFGTIKNSYIASKIDIQHVIGDNIGQQFDYFRMNFDPEKKLLEFQKKEIQVISLEDDLYPIQLKQISDPPICLYVKGKIDLMDFANSYFFAIVGTRKPTPYGQQITYKFSKEMSKAGFIIVSGLAMGVDTCAHKAVIDINGKTIAVLGCGVDMIYPAINKKLYEDILINNGLIISEFPPGHLVLKGLFVARNRIISGLSKGVLVTEGLCDSGALITARYAAEQGKDVFALPGLITSPLSQAPHFLLQKGAKLVTSVEDIFEEMGVKLLPIKKEQIELQLSKDEKEIFSILQKEPLIIDDLAKKIHVPVNKVLQTISLLEIAGIIEKNSERKYQIRL
ncbi:MAG: DNA-processing protein DprA [bacterium]|nr:DNA-processing protein DprA [bacterium]